MIINLLIVLAIIAIVFLVIVALRPAHFRVERSATVSAPAAAAFAYVNDLHRWQEMSPYVKLDLAAKHTFAGPRAGVGASLAWVGNSKVGEGSITITESRPEELVRMTLASIRPFACTNTVEFTFRQTGAQTVVTWSLFGQNSFIGKAMGLIMNLDKMVGGQFEEGLANLKALAEAAARKQSHSS